MIKDRHSHFSVGTGIPTFNPNARATAICRVCQRNFKWYAGMGPVKHGVGRCPEHPAKAPSGPDKAPNEANRGTGTTPTEKIA